MLGFWIHWQLRGSRQRGDGADWLPPERTRALLLGLARQVDPVTRRNWKENDLRRWWLGLLDKHPELKDTQARDFEWVREVLEQGDKDPPRRGLPRWITSDRWLRELPFGEAAAFHVVITFLVGIVIIVVLALSL